jgi:hypothetical protein
MGPARPGETPLRRDATMRKLPLAEIVVGSLALLAGVGVYVWAHSDQATLEESKELGAAVVAALQAHRADTGTYPAALEDLVPAYLPRLEQPTWGLEQWRYRRYTPDEVTAGAVVPADSRNAPAAQVDSSNTPAARADSSDTPAPVGSRNVPAPQADSRNATAADAGGLPDTSGGDPVYFQLSVAANPSGYPVLYYDYTGRRWVLNN